MFLDSVLGLVVVVVVVALSVVCVWSCAVLVVVVIAELADFVIVVNRWNEPILKAAFLDAVELCE